VAIRTRFAHCAPAVGLGVALTALAFLHPAVAAAQTGQSGSARLQTVLHQMDAASASFQSAEADLRKEVFTKVIQDTEEQKGEIYFVRKGGSMQMGMRLTTPPQQVVEYKDGVVRVYNPGTNHIDTVSASGANKGRFETFLTLGFGGSGKDLAKAWTITDDGPEPMSDGQKTVATEKLDLVSKDPGVLKNVSRVTIWVDPARSVSLKQLLYFPNGDTQTAFYTNIRLNGKIDLGQFAIKCKGSCS
jgi:outer membrane lipoprotein-sorting protein